MQITCKAIIRAVGNLAVLGVVLWFGRHLGTEKKFLNVFRPQWGGFKRARRCIRVFTVPILTPLSDL